MHKLAIVLLSLMLIVAPVYGQAIPPTPTPNASSIVRDVAEATQALGTVTVVILAVLAVLVLIVVFFVLAVWRLGTPLVTTVQRLIEARDRRDQDDDARKLAQIAVLERYKTLLEDIETRDDANKGRTTAVATINKAVGDEHEKTRTLVANAIEKLTNLEATMNTRFDTVDDSIHKAFEEVKKSLLELRVSTTADTDAPAKGASPDSASIGEVDAKGEKE